MADRRSLLAIVLLAAALHAVGIARTLVPAQDGLKLIRFARQFQNDPWADVIRGADVHPLYPALIAIAEPVVARAVGEGPDAWRLSAQIIATMASLALLVPIYFLTEGLFDSRIAFLAAGLLALLPRIAEVGHETLADSMGLCATFTALWLAAQALNRGDRRIGAASGFFTAIGYLARPEVILVPIAIGLTWTIDRLRPTRNARPRAIGTLAMIMLLPAVAVIGYAGIKGQISEKLSIRAAAGLGPQFLLKRNVPQPLPSGLNDPTLDFSAKEESDHIAIRGVGEAARRVFGRWWEGLVWYFAVMTVWGLARRREIRAMLAGNRSAIVLGIEGRLLGTFALIDAVALLRHSATLGYLSGRHVLPLVVASIPWAAGGAYICWRRIGELMRLSPRTMGFGRMVPFGMALLLCIGAQLNPTHSRHLSRWGHWSAGRWLSAHAAPGEEVLDTRGWARFISGLPGYDYWHIRQALTDAHLSYILVELDELEAKSARARTLRSLLAFAATPIEEFPAGPADPRPAVRIYRYRRPASWEGFTR